MKGQPQQLLNLIFTSTQKNSIYYQIKINIFNFFYIITKNHNDTWMKLILFTFIELLQLIAFPLSPSFNSFYNNKSYLNISYFFQYFSIINIWNNNYLFYFIALTLSFIYIFILLFLCIFITIKLASFQKQSISLIKTTCSLFSFQQILSLPILSKYSYKIIILTI